LGRCSKRTPTFTASANPTRGGVATVLNELAAASNVAMRIDERQIPVREAVRGACEMLGFDPVYVANEGKLVDMLFGEQLPRIC